MRSLLYFSIIDPVWGLISCFQWKFIDSLFRWFLFIDEINHRGIYIELNSQVTKSSFKTKKAWVYNLTSLNREKSPTEREITYCINYISLALAAWGFLPHRYRPPQAWFYIIFLSGSMGRWVPVWYESSKIQW